MDFEYFIEELAKALTVKLLVVIVAGSIATYALVENQTQPNEESSELSENDVKKDLTAKNFNKNRRPASLRSNGRNDSSLYRPKAKITPYNESNFVPPGSSAANEFQESNLYSGNSSTYQSLFSNTPTTYPLSRQEAGNENFPSSKANSNRAAEEITFLGAGTTTTNDKKSAAKKEVNTESSSSSSNSTSSTTPTENSCSANVVSGSFGNPVGITLACSYPSTIKYCLSNDGTCCDPESGGRTYSSQES